MSLKVSGNVGRASRLWSLVVEGVAAVFLGEEWKHRKKQSTNPRTPRVLEGFTFGGLFERFYLLQQQ